MAGSDQPLRDVLCRVLDQGARFKVMATASTGEEAASVDAPFDVALVDLAIRGLDSLSTVARLRERTPPPTVIVLAPTNAIYLRHVTEAAGAAGLLVISEDLVHLTDRLAHLVDGL